MKILMIMLSGVMLVNSQDMGKERFESITHTQVVEQYKIIPNEVVQQAVAKKATSKAKTTKKKTTKKATKKKVTKKAKKKVVKKAKKKVVKKKKAKKKTIKKVYMNARGSRAEIQSYAHSLVISYGWSEYDWECLVKLWYRESSWNPNAVNKKSGACGVPQSLPCSKMASEGADYRTNYKTQVRWGCKYIKARYGTPSKAWEHSQKKGWY